MSPSLHVGAVSGPIQPRVATSFERQGLMKTLGATLVHADEGVVRIELPVVAAISQQHGFVHAGAITSIVDSACGYAALTLMPAGADVLTIEFKMNFLAPARGDRLIAEGRVRKAGKTLSFTEGEVWVHHGGDRTMVATITATMITRMPPSSHA